ncbi:L,D-transpeptidase [Mycobacterium sp. 29Ha]|uniref:L,D-transpeptidase n=1 Tax=Mycobacterium sp. 29Ha TaxID=2939268 RepID=UPI002938E562|nr:L,D-transpeptidase [Mycobacterium sp. 29Ha]MDV3136368.1 L,D-transpeptidase [Mycobacterium sp. 29Ha]
MRGVVLCAFAAIAMNAIVPSGPPENSVLVANPSSSYSAATNPLYNPAIASVLPAQGDVVGIAQPVVVTFGAPVVDKRAAERAIDIQSSPAMTGKFEWVDNSAVKWVPDQFWPAHSTIALSVRNIPLTNFQTGAAVIGTANIADKTFTVTIDGVPPSDLPSPHHRANWGKPGVFPASMGRPTYPTPVGTYTVMARERDVVMDSSSVGIPIDSPDGYLLDVEYAIRFTARGLFVHSAPWAINSLGYENVSHGCIGLSTEDAEWYFNTVKVGDPIIVQENSIEVPRVVTS